MAELNYLDNYFLSFTKGNSLLGDLEIIYKFSIHRKNIVELGTAYGIGAMMLLGGCEGIVTTIDNHSFYRDSVIDGTLYTPEEKYKIVKKYLEMFSKKKIRTIMNDTVKEADNWQDETVDLLFVDGGHDYGQVKADYFAWYSKVQIDGIILFHDVRKECGGVWKFWNTDIKKELKENRIRELIQKPKYQTVCKVVVKEK